jgi:hypothetical protein
MKLPVDQRAASTNGVFSNLSADEVSLVLSALWLWRGQLGRVGSEMPIPGLGTLEARQTVDEVARKLGADPSAYFYGVQPPRGR